VHASERAVLATGEFQNAWFWRRASSRTTVLATGDLQNDRFWQRAHSRTRDSGDGRAPERAVLAACVVQNKRFWQREFQRAIMVTRQLKNGRFW